MKEKPTRIWINQPETDIGEVIWTSDEQVEPIRDLSRSVQYVRADLYDNAIDELELTRKNMAQLRRWLEQDAGSP